MEYKIFTKPETDEYDGFEGQVKVFDTIIYLNTKTGEGFDAALKKMDRLVHSIRKRFYSKKWFSIEDAQQDIKLKILESLKKFDPRKDVRLNTYIQLCLECKLKNMIRDENTNANNATTLKVDLRRYSCKCGNIFERIEDDKSEKTVCPNCQSSDNLKQMKIAQKEVVYGEWAGKEYMMTRGTYNPENGWILKHDFENYVAENDVETNEFLEMILFKDFSLSEIAEELDVSKQTVSNRLKEIQNDKRVKEWAK